MADVTVPEPTVPLHGPTSDPPQHNRRLPRPAFVIIAIFAGMFFTFVLSTLLAGSANAAPETDPSSPLAGQVGSVVPAGTVTRHLSSMASSTSRRIPVTSVANLTRPVTSIATPVVHDVSLAVRPIVTRVAKTVNRSIPVVSATSPISGAVPKTRSGAIAIDGASRIRSTGHASPRLPASTTRVTADSTEGGRGQRRAASTTVGSPPAPPLRLPLLPTRNLPSTPGNPGEGLPSGHGNGQFGSILSRGLLLPASLEGTASLGQERVPCLLLDMRQSPPG